MVPDTSAHLQRSCGIRAVLEAQSGPQQYYAVDYNSMAVGKAYFHLYI